MHMLCTYTCIYICTHIHIQTKIYIYTHIYMYIGFPCEELQLLFLVALFCLGTWTLGVLAKPAKLRCIGAPRRRLPMSIP